MENFNEKTLVAFMDISGFKAMMKREIDAYRVMKDFYKAGFRLLKNQTRVKGFFVSDCGILSACKGSANQKIEDILNIVAQINREMLINNIMLTTSIAYGKFRYTDLIEHESIEKMGLFGNGYLNAYIDSEVTKPKMTPGQCRINIEGLPSNYIKIFEKNKLCIKREEFNLPAMEPQVSDKYLYYYWMINKELENPFNKCKDFEATYTNCYNINKEYKYIEMKNLLIRTLNQNFPIISFN